MVICSLENILIFFLKYEGIYCAILISKGLFANAAENIRMLAFVWDYEIISDFFYFLILREKYKKNMILLLLLNKKILHGFQLYVPYKAYTSISLLPLFCLFCHSLPPVFLPLNQIIPLFLQNSGILLPGSVAKLILVCLCRWVIDVLL